MADATIVHIGENSPEQVAYKLMRDIATSEGKPVGIPHDPKPVDRKWILDTYAECLTATKSHRLIKP